jgi:hypothetical protein
MDGADAKPNLVGYLAQPLRLRSEHLACLRIVDRRTPKPLALCLGPRQSRVDARRPIRRSIGALDHP